MSAFRELAPKPEDAAAEALLAETTRQAHALAGRCAVLAGRHRDACLGYWEAVEDPWRWVGEAAPLLEQAAALLGMLEDML